MDRRGRACLLVASHVWLASLVAACASSRPAPTSDAGAAPDTPAFGGSTEVDPYDPDVALPARVEALFLGCGGGPENACHAIGAGGMFLRLGADGDVVGVRSSERPELVRVKPFAPDESYLYLKVLGDGGIEGGRMPLDGVADPRTTALVLSWIEAGAPSP